MGQPEVSCGSHSDLVGSTVLLVPSIFGFQKVTGILNLRSSTQAYGILASLQKWGKLTARACPALEQRLTGPG